MTQVLKWAAQLLVLWGQVQWGTPWWQQGLSNWSQNCSLSFSIWRKDKWMHWAWCRWCFIQFVSRWRKPRIGHSNRVMWSQSLSEDTHFQILLPLLKPENKLLVFIYVTLDHKNSLKSLGYICSNSQKYIVWVKMFYCKYIKTFNLLLVICIA